MNPIENNIEELKKRDTKALLITFNIIWLVLLLPVLLIIFFSIYLFVALDFKNIFVLISFYSLISIPIFFIISIPISWILYAYKLYDSAKIFIFLPVYSFLILIINIIIINNI